MAGKVRGGAAVLVALLLPACNLTYTPDDTSGSGGSGGPTGLFLPYDGQADLDTNPQFGWYAVPGTTSYELQIAMDAGFSQIIWDEPGIFPETTILTQATLTNVTTYFWRVYATVPGLGGPLLVDGSPFQFSTQGTGNTFPQAFTIKSPPDLSTNIDPSTLFTWYASARAWSYTIEVDPAGTFSPAPYSQSGIHINRGFLPVALPKGTNYSWRVIAIGEAGNAISNVAVFRTAP
jgi:hypothetical protein